MTYIPPTISAQEAWNADFDNIPVQYARVESLSDGKLCWHDAVMEQFTKDELKSTKYLFRLKPLVINGFEIEPPLTQKQVDSLKPTHKLYSFEIHFMKYHWLSDASCQAARRAVQSLFSI